MRDNLLFLLLFVFLSLLIRQVAHWLCCVQHNRGFGWCIRIWFNSWIIHVIYLAQVKRLDKEYIFTLTHRGHTWPYSHTHTHTVHRNRDSWILNHQELCEYLPTTALGTYYIPMHFNASRFMRFHAFSTQNQKWYGFSLSVFFLTFSLPLSLTLCLSLSISLWDFLSSLCIRVQRWWHVCSFATSFSENCNFWLRLIIITARQLNDVRTCRAIWLRQEKNTHWNRCYYHTDVHVSVDNLCFYISKIRSNLLSSHFFFFFSNSIYPTEKWSRIQLPCPVHIQYYNMGIK